MNLYWIGAVPRANYAGSEAIVTPAESEWREAQSAGGTNEIQLSEIECTEICGSNYPASGGGYRRYPPHPTNVVGRDAGFEAKVKLIPIPKRIGIDTLNIKEYKMARN